MIPEDDVHLSRHGIGDPSGPENDLPSLGVAAIESAEEHPAASVGHEPSRSLKSGLNLGHPEIGREALGGGARRGDIEDHEPHGVRVVRNQAIHIEGDLNLTLGPREGSLAGDPGIESEGVEHRHGLDHCGVGTGGVIVSTGTDHQGERHESPGELRAARPMRDDAL